jgi:aerobic-type carbon monoxide dehydrogenase small subunit (CoxS/CutS family)
MTTQQVSVTVNGVHYEREVEARLLLADFLRQELNLGGTHVGCEHGVCGACSILIDGKSVRSCLMLAAQVDGLELTTIEGLRDAKSGQLHPVQQAFVDERGMQCGFCTPGFVISTVELLGNNPNPTDDEIKDVLGGNLCRCTGYETILRAVRLASAKAQSAKAASHPSA